MGMCQREADYSDAKINLSSKSVLTASLEIMKD